MISFTKRNLYIFFRDKTAVFFSLLASLIIIGLYVLFLGDVWASNFNQFPNARELMDNWVMAGLLSITSLTTTMGAFGIMVTDRTKKIDKDFLSSPISRRSIAGGYVLSAFIIGFILSVITLILAQIYIVAEGGAMLSLPALLKVLALILLADLTNTAMIFLLTSFFKSETAFSTASTVIGTLIGFLAGIYLPIGVLPVGVQWIIKLFPTAHAAVLMRQVMMKDAMSTAFTGVPEEYITEFKQVLGVTFQFGDIELGTYTHLLVLAGTAVIFFLFAVFVMSRKRR